MEGRTAFPGLVKNLQIVNLSLETSVMPNELKKAVIHPLLMKRGLDHQHYIV